MYIGASGIAFTSYDTQAQKHSKDELKNEIISFDDTMKQTNQSSGLLYQTTTKDNESKSIAFRDPVSGKMAIVSLKDSTIDKLKEFFGEDDIVTRNDGIVRLDNKAEAFVAGWFADIAYKREFLSADKDHDGQLNAEEYKNTRNTFGEAGVAITETSSGVERLAMAKEKIVDTYGLIKESDYINYREMEHPVSLDDELNTTIEVDANFDGKMDIKEAYSVESDGSYEKVILRHLNQMGIPNAPSDLDFGSLGIDNIDFALSYMIDTFMSKNIDEDKEKQKEIFLKQLDQLLNENAKKYQDKKLSNQEFQEEIQENNEIEQLKKIHQYKNEENKISNSLQDKNDIYV